MGIFSAIASAAGLGLNYLNQKKQMDKQDQYALNGITYKARDAMAAYKETGLHPLSLLGVNTMSYNPVAVGDMSAPLADMGQNVERARMATAPPVVRGAGKALEALTLERAGLENDKLRSEIMTMNRTVGPPMPSGISDLPGETHVLPGGIKMALPPGVSPMQNLSKDWGDELPEAAYIPEFTRQYVKGIIDKYFKYGYSQYQGAWPNFKVAPKTKDQTQHPMMRKKRNIWTDPYN